MYELYLEINVPWSMTPISLSIDAKRVREVSLRRTFS